MARDVTRQCNHCKKVFDISLTPCSNCQSVHYCSRDCQTSHIPQHTLTCAALANLNSQRQKPIQEQMSTSQNVPAVDLLGGENHPFNPKEVVLTASQADDILNGGKGFVSPISKLIGVPLVVYRQRESGARVEGRSAAMDNQAVTYLMIDIEHGFAPDEWQHSIGPVTVVRTDRKPLTTPALEMIWMYVDLILDHFGEEGEAPKWRYTPQAFQEWCRRYKMNNQSCSGVELPL